jgi:hypothetical protein
MAAGMARLTYPSVPLRHAADVAGHLIYAQYARACSVLRKNPPHPPHLPTLVTAQQLGLPSVGIELDPGYCAAARRRICQPSETIADVAQ